MALISSDLSLISLLGLVKLHVDLAQAVQLALLLQPLRMPNYLLYGNLRELLAGLLDPPAHCGPGLLEALVRRFDCLTIVKPAFQDLDAVLAASNTDTGRLCWL